MKQENVTCNLCAALLRVALAALPTMTAFGQALPGTVSRTVEVYPGAEKNKAFPLDQGSGMCDLHLDPEDPWRIRHSDIEASDDQTLWYKVSDHEYYMSYGYAPNEYVVVKGELYKPATGSGKGDVKLPEFLVTVPKVNLDWDAKHGEAAKEFAEDLVPAAILVSPNRADFGSLIVYGPKDDFNISSSDVTLSWDNANKVKVHDGATEIRSGHKFSIMQGASKTLLVEALEPAPDVKFTLEGEPDNVNGERAVDYVHACCVKIELVTPDGDPVNAPDDSGDGQNEFTFSPANPGVLTMELKAKVRPAQAADKVAKDCVFSVDAIGASTMKWANNNPGGKAVADNGFLKATVTFTGLPAQNSDFGKKVAKISYGAHVCDKNDYEVFFPKNEINHPSNSGNASWPNWMYYWLQTVSPLGNPSPRFVYGNSSGFYPGTQTICLSVGDSVSYSAPYGVNNPLDGIDNFSWTVIHESQHYKDWLDLWGNNVTTWMAHRGGNNPQDDKDGDRIQNRIEDINLNGVYDNATDLYDWQNPNTPTPNRPGGIINDFEDWNCQRHKDAKGDHSKDWGDPGMQHKTKDKYDD